MDVPPRDKHEGVITTQMWLGIVFVGTVMAAGTLLIIDASLPGGFIEGSGNLRHAQTMAFTTLMMFQLFNVFNAKNPAAVEQNQNSAITPFGRAIQVLPGREGQVGFRIEF